GQRSALNDYARSKSVELLHLPDMEVSEEKMFLGAEECANHCTEKSECRAFNFNWKNEACQLLAWTHHMANTELQRNVHNDLYEKKDYVLDCIKRNGKNYRGRQSVTEHGITCQAWRSKSPHDHRFALGPTNGLEENYCRNPDGDSKGPWCYTTNEDIRVQSCGIKKCETAECVSCNGEDYRGFVDYTKSKRECQRWDLQHPHKHPFRPEKYPDKSLDDNYCRNPDSSQQPWCYTTDSSVEREFCHIKPCRETPQTKQVEVTKECFKQRGEGYRGQVNVTTSGIPCQRWNSRHPHRHHFLPRFYGCKGLEENYCRNPDGSEYPWCFTSLPEMRVAFCLQIDRCNDDVESEVDCYHKNGETYRGTISRTRKGITCQKWSAQYPHKTKFTPTTHPHADLVENYCRNPDGDKHGPWCYTVDPNTKFDYCAIELCQDAPPPVILIGEEKVEFDKCGKRDDRKRNKSRIVGGTPGNSPWTVSLRNREGVHFCGGTLVSTGWVISTRQCFSSCDANLDGYEAWMGTLFKDPKPNEPDKQAIPISQIVCGPSESNLVMLQLAREAELNDRVAVICLPPEQYIIEEGKQCEIAGWGDTRGTASDSVLLIAMLPILSNGNCNKYLWGRVKDNELCTFTKFEMGACEGDYGGPLACITDDCWVLQGVIIPGRGCGRKNQPAVYIRVATYVDWIKKVMEMT
uniref:Macrophage stimulating 1 n=1 Tax=Latimeria chalumnae TaxID=7897 RepID=H3AXI3_LATCH